MISPKFPPAGGERRSQRLDCLQTTWSCFQGSRFPIQWFINAWAPLLPLSNEVKIFAIAKIIFYLRWPRTWVPHAPRNGTHAGWFHSFKTIRSSSAILTLVIVISAILWWIFCLKHFFFDQFSNCSTTTQSLAQRNRMWLMITGCHFKSGWMIYKINFRKIWILCLCKYDGEKISPIPAKD